MTVKDQLNKAGKALLAFVGLVAANLGQIAVTTHPGEIVPRLPATVEEWGTLIFTTAVGTGIVWIRKNYPSVAQAEKKLDEARNRVEDGKQSQ